MADNIDCSVNVLLHNLSDFQDGCLMTGSKAIKKGMIQDGCLRTRSEAIKE